MLKLTFKEDIVLFTTDGPICMRRNGQDLVIDAPESVKIRRVSTLPEDQQQFVKEKFDSKEERY